MNGRQKNKRENLFEKLRRRMAESSETKEIQNEEESDQGKKKEEQCQYAYD